MNNPPVPFVYQSPSVKPPEIAAALSAYVGGVKFSVVPSDDIVSATDPRLLNIVMLFVDPFPVVRMSIPLVPSVENVRIRP